MYSKIIKKILPVEVVNIIKDEQRSLYLLIGVGGFVSTFIGAELVCLFLLGKILLGQPIPFKTDELSILNYTDNLTQSELLIFFGGLFALVILLRYSFFILYHYLSLNWNAIVSSRLQNKMMEAILFAPISHHDKSKQSGMIHGLMEAAFGVCFTIDAIAALIASFFNTLLILLTIIFISPWLIIGSVIIGIPIFLGLMNPMQRRVRKLKDQFINGRTLAMEMAMNVINGVSDIKSLSSESITADRFSQKVEISQTAFKRARFIKKLPGPTLQGIFQFAFALAIIISGFLLSPKDLTEFLPSLAVFGYGMFRIYPAITDLIKNRLELFNALPDLQVIAGLTELSRDDLSKGKYLAPDNFNGIHFKGVSFSYNVNEPVFNNLDFSIKAGTLTSFVGTSGAGKSTIIDLILKFRSPNNGVVCIGNQNLSDTIRKDWLNRLGVVRQDVFLFGGTIRENFLAWNPNATKESMLLACKQSGIFDFINDLPDGLDTVVGDRGVTISGGQRQRLAIARALLRNPEVLILDEALSALDGETEAEVMKSLREGAPKRTIILVSHRLVSIKKSDKIIVLDNGKVVEQGIHNELISLGGRYMEIFSTQINVTA